jgi:hypothetical protein
MSNAASTPEFRKILQDLYDSKRYRTSGETLKAAWREYHARYGRTGTTQQRRYAMRKTAEGMNPLDQSNEWRLYTYDVWGNARDGFDVNDVFKTSTILEFSDNASDADIVKALKKAGYLRKGIRTSSIKFDGDDETIYFSDARNGRPEGELRREKKEI